MTARTLRFTTPHMIGRREVELVVTYTMTPVVAATYWQPAEGGEIELVSINHDGRTFPLSAAEEGALHDMACERSGEDWAEDDYAAAEYRAELRAEDLMVERWENEA